MAKSIYGFSESLPTDPITGCLEVGDYQCKQAFYLKQQNEILKGQETNTKLQQENTELKTQLQNLQNEIETLRTQQTSQVQQEQHNLFTASLYGVSVPSLLIIFAVVVVAAILMGKKFFTKKV